MSFRELRDFTEYMRVLGYPRLVSVDNFRTPNFALVADVLFWMVHRYDESAALSDDISTEDCRIDFLTSVATIMWTKAGVKLNTKRLYSADGMAVKELLKIAQLLYAAHRANVAPSNSSGDESKRGEDTENDPIGYPNVYAKLPDPKATRKLASAITESGAKLFDLLDEEREMTTERQRCLWFLDSISNNLESTTEHKFLDQKLQELVAGARDHSTALNKQCQDLASDEKTLQVKIKKKQGELERNDQRLKSLQSVRPAFMDEYEKLEAELGRLYELYLEKFRNLDYLEHRLEAFNNKEREKLEESERARKRIQMDVMERKARDLRGEEDEHLYADDGHDSGEDDPQINPIEQTATEARRDPSRQSGGESDISAESDDSGDDSSSDISDESSVSGSLSDDNDDDLIDDDDGLGSVNSSASEDDIDEHASSASSESDDNF